MVPVSLVGLAERMHEGMIGLGWCTGRSLSEVNGPQGRGGGVSAASRGVKRTVQMARPRHNRQAAPRPSPQDHRTTEARSFQGPPWRVWL